MVVGVTELSGNTGAGTSCGTQAKQPLLLIMGLGGSCAQCSVWLLSRMKISKWRWSSISVSAQLQLKGTLALLLVGNVVFVIAQVRVSCFGGVSGL